jgi:ankyrin repeat protein
MHIRQFIPLFLTLFTMSGCLQANLNMSTNNSKSSVERKFVGTQYSSHYEDFQRFADLIEAEDTTSKEIKKFLDGIASLECLYEYEDDMCGFIHYAAANGDTRMVNLLMARGVSINLKSQKGKTALHFAVEDGWESLAKSLLEIDQSGLYARDNEGNTPLHLAIIARYNDVANFLIDQADANGLLIQDNDGYTALHIAVGLGFDDVVSNLLAKQPKLINMQDHTGDTALHIAVLKEHIDVIKILLQKGNADTNIKDKEGFTALALAYNDEDDDENKDVKEQIINLLTNSGAK